MGKEGERKMVLFQNVSIPSLSFDAHLFLLIQAHFRYQYKQRIKGKMEKKPLPTKKSENEERRIELYSSYLSFLSMSCLLSRGVQLWQKK